MVNSYTPKDNFSNLKDTYYFKTGVEDNSFLLFSQHRNNYFESVTEKLDKNSEGYVGYVLEEYFFSKDNMEIIQKKVILGVFNKSNKEFLIPPQNNKSIEVVMKYIYGKYSQNLPYNITQQVRDLNQLVADELIPMIVNNCRSKQKYLRDISTQPLGPELPTNINSAGNKTLPSVTNTF